MTHHINKFSKGLTTFMQANHQLAVEETENTFEENVNDWDEISRELAKVKALTKVLAAEEKKQRDAVASSLQAFLKGNDRLKEGVNNYELSNGRTLKYTYKLTRTIEPSLIDTARAQYYGLTPEANPTVDFDDLLRLKYELVAAPFKKLDNEQLGAISPMLTTKPAACDLVVD